MSLKRFWWLPFGRAAEVTPSQLKQWLDEGRPVQLVDARTKFEYQQGTIHSAQHAPVTTLPDSIDRLDLDPNNPVVLLCLSGHRSRPGTRLLRSRGIEAYSMRGGITAWKLNGYPIAKPDINKDGKETSD
jgi:rhodanese-related sulfurtransferase